MRQENECVVSDWKLIPFTSNIEMLSGFPFDSSHFNDSEGKPLIRIRNIISGKTETFFSGEFSNDYLIRKGDILVGMDGDFHIKKWQGSESLLNQRILKLYESETSQINIDFFYYLSQPFLLKVHKRTAGTTVKHLSTKDFKNASFKIPSYKEQQKIAEILSTVDAKIEVIDQQITETQDLKKGLMQRLLTKGIGHTEFKESALGEIPKSWEVVKFSKLISKEVITHIQDGNHGGSHPVSDDFVNEGIPFIMANCITKSNKLNLSKAKRISEKQYNSLRIGFAKPNDVLLTHKGTVGLTAMVNTEHGNLMLTPQVTYYRITDENVLIRKYLYYYFQSSLFQNLIDKFSKQSTRAYIGITNQKKLPITLPSDIIEQKRITDILSSIDNKLEVLSDKKETYQELKKGLMQQLLTGKVRVKV